MDYYDIEVRIACRLGWELQWYDWTPDGDWYGIYGCLERDPMPLTELRAGVNNT